MKFTKYVLITMCILIITGCATTARESTGRTDLGEMFEPGKGRPDMTLAIERPRGIGLANDEERYLFLIEGALINDFRTFSEIQQVSERDISAIVARQQEALGGQFAETLDVGVGNIIAAPYTLQGELTKAGNTFTLSLRLVDVNTAATLASFNRPIRLRQINDGSASRAAVKEILTQINVVFTPEGIAALDSELTAEEIEAQNNTSLSFAERHLGGSLMGAYIYSLGGNSSDRSEEIHRMMGGEGARIIDDFNQQEYWKNSLIAFEDHFRKHPPFEIVYTSVPVQKGMLDYEAGTVDFEFTIGMRHRGVSTMQTALRNVLRDLQRTNNRRNRWGFNDWPRVSAQSTRNAQIDYDVFSNYRTFNIVVGILNDNDDVVETISFPLYGQLTLGTGNAISAMSTQERQMVITVPRGGLSDGMHIQVISIDGVDADKSNIDAYVRNSAAVRMPMRSRNTIGRNQQLIPELPEERQARLDRERIESEREASWAEKPLQSRGNVNVGAIYNPALGGEWEDALAIEAGIGLGYRNFSFSGRIVAPMSLFTGGSKTFGVGGALGYTYVWEHILASLEGGIMYYTENATNSIDEMPVIPTLEAMFDFAPWGKSLGFKLGYRLEFGSIETVGYAKAGFALWF